MVLDTNHSTATLADDAVLTGDNGNGILEVNETWTYSYDHVVTQTELTTRGIDGDNSLDNVASVTTDQTVPDSDDAHIPIVLGPGVRTPGFWSQDTGQNQWTKFWDGIVGNEPKQAGTDGFASGEITYAVDSNTTASSMDRIRRDCCSATTTWMAFRIPGKMFCSSRQAMP